MVTLTNLSPISSSYAAFEIIWRFLQEPWSVRTVEWEGEHQVGLPKLLVPVARSTLQRCCRTRVLVEVQVKLVPNSQLVVVVVPRCLEVVQLDLIPATLALLARNGGEEAPGVEVVRQVLVVVWVLLAMQEVLEPAVLWW